MGQVFAVGTTALGVRISRLAVGTTICIRFTPGSCSAYKITYY